MSGNETEPKMVVYLPPNAKVNSENKNAEPPVPKYNRRKKILDIDAVKKLVGGSYGKKED